LAYFDRLGHSDRKVFRLFNQARRIQFVRLGRVNHIEAKYVFLAANADVKTISIIGWIDDEPAILKDSPIVACAKIGNRRPKDRGNDYSSGKSQRDRRAKDQTGTSNWLISLNVS
jgi:hypothetical protein